MIDPEKEFDRVYGEVLGLDGKIMDLVREVARKAFYEGLRLGKKEANSDKSKPLERLRAG